MSRLVDVAVDAPGVLGGVLYTWSVPPTLADLAVGEAVLVGYGRREAVGVVLQEHPPGDEPVDVKPVLARIRSDGPLLTPLQARLAVHVTRTYLAPAGMVVRQMLPPHELERLDQVVVAAGLPGEGSAGPPGSGAAPGSAAALDARIVAAVDAAREILVDDLVRDVALDGKRATLLRRVRALEAAGHLRVEWRLRPTAVRIRQERRATLSIAGRTAADLLSRDERPPGARPGLRQVALIRELAAQPDGWEEPTARLAERHGSGTVSGLVRRGWLELVVADRERRPLEHRAVGDRGALPAGADLAPDQRAVVDRLSLASATRRPDPVLLDGVVASGKTAIHVTLVERALAAGRDALVLVPEVSLALPLVDRLRHDLGIEPVLLHSGLSEGERADEWRRLRRATTPQVVVGTRLAILAPVRDPGVIVVDEEHDPAYKSDRTPRIQARDLAIVLGRLAAAPVLLGSATPDLVTIGRARAGELGHLRLTGRRVGQAPSVEVVDLRAELADGNRGLLSSVLAEAIGALDRDRGEQAILVINRRGSSSVVLCRDCGYVQVCPECHRPLVFHATSMALRCHHCGASAPPARRCPSCGSVRIRYLGGGTEKVEHEVRVRFPELRVGRLDRDVAERRGAAAAVLDAFSAGELDVLVGTSLVTKGLDIPGVTLVGVVSADIALTLPDERAAERTWQLLAQAVGRAGRGDLPGRAIIQSYLPDHPAIVAVATGDPGPFIEEELGRRRGFGSPPYGRLVKLTVALEDRTRAEAEAARMADRLRAAAAARPDPTSASVLGPVAAYIVRRAGRWRFHVVLRGDAPLQVLGGDPGAPWSVDVDPESLL
ncbi:MAG: primosomal protein N' [Chloroflexi bacterium]|nr:primosomal protein N' [Chloroflexota bacterium]